MSHVDLHVVSHVVNILSHHHAVVSYVVTEVRL